MTSFIVPDDVPEDRTMSDAYPWMACENCGRSLFLQPVFHGAAEDWHYSTIESPGCCSPECSNIVRGDDAIYD